MTPTKAAFSLLICAGFLALGQPTTAVAAEARQKPERPRIYDTKADGKEQIATALKTAQAEDKRVILKFGANW